MKIADPPKNETARIFQLNSYNVLDTMPEQAYDDITFIASTICDTPIALISLIDEHRQWFKSKVGLECDETDRDAAFCTHALVEPDQLLVIEDALEDDRFVDNPLVTGDPNIRFYAGAVLCTPTGEALGTVCVIDRVPRTLSETQRRGLKSLARLTIAQLELRKAMKDMEQYRKSKKNELLAELLDD